MLRFAADPEQEGQEVVIFFEIDYNLVEGQMEEMAVTVAAS